MSEIIEKLKLELCDLTLKYNKLGIFMDSEEFTKLDEYLQERIIEQHQAMLNYKWALINRIEYMEE